MSKPFWDVEETTGFVLIKSPIDSLQYKVYNTGTPEERQKVADLLASVRREMNKLLVYLCKHPKLWLNKQIALGIFLTFDIHMPCVCKIIEQIYSSKTFNDDLNNLIISECTKMSKLFSIQEMTPNNHGIIGLNKPKKTKFIKVPGTNQEYEVASKRSFHLTIRKGNKIDDYETIMGLFLHEITHTTCNDIHWKDDNHQYPYGEYHSFMRKCAKECGISFN